jgi:hypothetical protein
MKKIDIEKLGEVITEYKDGKPWSSMYSPKHAIEQVAEKLNEIIDLLSTHPTQGDN